MQKIDEDLFNPSWAHGLPSTSYFMAMKSEEGILEDARHYQVVYLDSLVVCHMQMCYHDDNLCGWFFSCKRIDIADPTVIK